MEEYRFRFEHIINSMYTLIIIGYDEIRIIALFSPL